MLPAGHLKNRRRETKQAGNSGPLGEHCFMGHPSSPKELVAFQPHVLLTQGLCGLKGLGDVRPYRWNTKPAWEAALVRPLRRQYNGFSRHGL